MKEYFEGEVLTRVLWICGVLAHVAHHPPDEVEAAIIVLFPERAVHIDQTKPL